MYFIELVNFSNSLQVVAEKIHSQLNSRSKNAYRWVAWTPELASLVPAPDISLIYAARLSRQSCSFLIDKCHADQIAIYGAVESGLLLPVLSSAANLDELAGLLPEKPLHVTSEFQAEFGAAKEWTKTVPASI